MFCPLLLTLPGNFVLCVIAGRRVHHFEIFFRDFDKKYCTNNGLKFASLDVRWKGGEKEGQGVSCYF